MQSCMRIKHCICCSAQDVTIYNYRLESAQGRSANDFVRHLKAAYVEALDAQQEGEIDPSAFDWAALSRHALLSYLFRSSAGIQSAFVKQS